VLEVCLHSQAAQRGLQTLVAHLSRVSFLGVAIVTVPARVDRRCRMRGSQLVVRTRGRRTVLRPRQWTGLADVVAVESGDVEPLQRKGRGATGRSTPRRRTSACRALYVRTRAERAAPTPAPA
jgi:hypothetical protein